MQRQSGVQQSLWTRRAAGHVDVHRHDLVHALDDGVIKERCKSRYAFQSGKPAASMQS
jgi:hypothetical protein